MIQNDQWWLWVPVFLCIVSPAIGSFCALVADRMLRGEPLQITNRSVCDHCGGVLAGRDLIPILSWTCLLGKSRCCGKPLPIRLLIVEVTALIGAVWAVSVTDGFVTVVSIGLFWVLLGLSVIDLATWRLPDLGTLPLIAAGLVFSIGEMTGPILNHVLGAVIGYGIVLLLRLIWQVMRGVEAIGLGDAKLLAAAGAWVGALAIPSVLLVACLFGLAIAMMGSLNQRKMHAFQPVPFGPALAWGFWITWLHGPLVF